MKNLFHKFGVGRSGWRLKGADLTETTENFSNPARGCYQIHTFNAQQEPDFQELEWCVDKKDTLALVLIDIGYFRDRDLEQEVLERIGRILLFFAERRYDCIVRVVYDHEGNAMEKEPFFFSQVLSHLRQMCVVMGQYADFIFVYQGMLVGNWGEMHTSRFLQEDKLIQMGEVLEAGLEGRVYLAVRRPVHWRMLHRNWAEDFSCAHAMGLFDDGMFGSESHMGTFGTMTRQTAAWDVPWVKEDELAFERELGKYAPMGGEAIYGEGYVETLTPEKVVRDFRKMQVTYLNKVYDEKILNLWKQWECPWPGVWKGKSVYEFVDAHLGYRLLVRKVSFAVKRETEEGVITVEAENTGFGGIYQEAELVLYVECYPMENASFLSNSSKENLTKGGENHVARPIRGWGGGEKREFSWQIELVPCALYLAAKRKQDGMTIRFANVSDGMGRVYLGHIHRR